jgi:hypothetical protein
MKTLKDFKEKVKEQKPQEQYTTSKIRAMCREGFELSTPHMIDISKGDIEDAPYPVRARIYQTLGKVGIGDPANVLIEKKELLQIVYRVTSEFVDTATFKKWLVSLQAAIEYPK